MVPVYCTQSAPKHASKDEWKKKIRKIVLCDITPYVPPSGDKIVPSPFFAVSFEESNIASGIRAACPIYPSGVGKKMMSANIPLAVHFLRITGT